MATIVNQRDILIQATGTRLYTTTLGSEYLIPFDQVNGSTKPANNATVGAIAGTNLKDASGTVLGDADVKNSVLVPSITAAATTSTWDGVSGSNKPHHYRIVAQGGSATGTPASPALYKDGSSFASLGRSYALTVISRATQAITFHSIYDVHGTAGENTRMANDLNSLGTDVIVVVATYDEPYGNRLLNGLAAAMYRCGASRAVFGSADFQYRSAYALVGIPGCGEGNGFEGYQGKVASDTNAWIDMAFTIAAGNITGVSGGYKGAKEFVGVTIDQYGIKVRNTLTGRVYFDASSDSLPWLVATQNESVNGGIDLVKPVDTDNNTQKIKTLRGAGSVGVSPTSDGNSVAITGLGSEIDSVVSMVDVTLTNTMTVPPGYSFQAGPLSDAYELEMDFYFTDVAGDTQFQIDIDAPSGRSVTSWVEVTQSPRVIGGDLIWPDYWFTEWASTIYYQQFTGAYPLRMRIKAYISPGTSSGGTINVSLGHDSGYNPKLRAGSSIKYSKFARQAAGAPASLLAARWGLPTSYTLYSENDNYRASGDAIFDLYFYPNGTWHIDKYLGGSAGPDTANGTYLSPTGENKGNDFEILISLSGAGTTNASGWVRLSETRTFNMGVRATFDNPSVSASTTATISIRKVGDSSSVQSCTLPVSATSIYTG